MKFELLLIGAGGHCRSCIDVIEKEDRFRIAGIVDKAGGAESLKLKAERGLEDRDKREAGSEKRKAEVLGYPIIGTDHDLPELRRKYQYAMVTVGQIKSPDIRIRLYGRLLELEFELPRIISPLAYVSRHAEIGQGTIIMHQALVNVGEQKSGKAASSTPRPWWSMMPLLKISVIYPLDRLSMAVLWLAAALL